MIALNLAMAAVLAAAPHPAKPAPRPPVVVATVKLKGTIRDAATHQPLPGALVQQASAVSSALSAKDGGFVLALDAHGGKTLEITCAGYDAMTVPVGSGPLTVELTPVASPIGSSPTAPADLEALAAPEHDLAPPPLGSEFWFDYRIRFEQLSAGGATLGGNDTNDFLGGGRLRWGPWLVEAEGAHRQVPTNVADLPAQENPVFAPSTWEFGGRASYVWGFGRHLDLAAGLGYRWLDTVPNNKGIPYTGSPLDVEQSRHVLGPVLSAAWRPAHRWSVEGLLWAAPVVSSWAAAPGTPYANGTLLDGRVGAYYELSTGLRLGVGYELESWQGNGSDTGHLVSLQLRYRPVSPS